MPSIFGKSGSTAGRAKTRHKSIRGTISAPIPMPQTPVDDEFPIRSQGSVKALTTADDEFPMRTPGAGIAMPLPPNGDLESPPADVVESEKQVEASQHEELQEQQPRDSPSSHGSSSLPEDAFEPGRSLIPVRTGGPAYVSGGSGGSQTGLAQDVRPEPPSTPPPAPPSSSDTPAARTISRPVSRSPTDRISPRKTSPLAVSPERASPPARRATNPVLSTIRYSMLSDAPSRQTSQSKDYPQRKKSTLRAALGKLFGRGKKKNGNRAQELGVQPEQPEREPRALAAAQHRSDPTALSRPNQRSPKRSASLPISEFDRPLRSHSIGPDDIMAIESARNSLQAEVIVSANGATPRRRAATAGGHTLLRPHLFNREFGAGLSPRPSSIHGRASRAGGRHGHEDPSEIGRAITSDSGGGRRRRSRSLSGLPDLAGVQRLGRRRSDEIRYWRESYDPGFMSPLSSNAQDDVDDLDMADISAPESPAVEKAPKTPPQPFNFGLLSKEMIGMKITHAADIDMRLETVEARTVRLEAVVSRLCRAVPGVKGIPESRDTLRPSSSRRSLESDAQSQALASDYPSLPASLRTPPYSSTGKPPSLPRSPLRPQQIRPPSNTTVRGAASLPTLSREAEPKQGKATSQNELIAQLRTDLDAERAARQALEAQVKKLSDRLNTLSTTMFAMVRGPSESRSQERLAPPSSVGGSSPLPSLPLTPKTLPVPLPLPLSKQEQLSVFETDDDDDEDEDEGEDDEEEDDDGTEDATTALESGTPTGLTQPTKGTSKTGVEEEDEEVTEDDFQTPREERTPMVGYGAFGEELRVEGTVGERDDNGGGGDGDGDEEEHKRRKAARTLSLSQLTLGKGQKTRI